MEVEEAHHYYCAMCQFNSLSRIAVVQHMVRHHRFDEKFVATCNFPNCQATYLNWASFKSHVVRKHRNEEPEPIQEADNVDVLHEEIAGRCSEYYIFSVFVDAQPVLGSRCN
jgi:hypothetical protein